MRHGKKGRKLGRTQSHKKAMIRNMVSSLVEVETIRTTDIKAKEVQPAAERLIALAKRGDLHARRLALRVIRSNAMVAKLFDEIAP
ncbi:MAG: 50S ribosomal protein L17, partial [Candidatus Latescibacterota bacterium]